MPDFHRMAQDAPTMADRFDVYAAEQQEQASYWAEQADYLRGEAAWCEAQVASRKGRAGGYEFRAEELRYDARGGMTEELTRRRFEPGAQWTARWAPGEVYTVRRREELPGETRVHFDRCWPSSVEIMSGGAGWLLLAVAPVAEAQARAASESRAEACGELLDVMREVLATGTACPLPQWERDDMAEERGETWDEPRKGE